MRTRVKVCGITREADAVAAVRHGADALGFVLWRPSPRYIEPEVAGAMARLLPAFVTPVCVFVNPSHGEVEKAIAQLPAAVLQFHGEETADFCAGFARPYIKAARMRNGLDLIEYLSAFTGAAAWLIDAFDEDMYGGTGNPFDWNLLPDRLARPWFLSGGLSAENVTEAVRRLRPYGVDVSSGVETAKGIKDAAKIAAFMAGVRNADQ